MKVSRCLVRLPILKSFFEAYIPKLFFWGSMVAFGGVLYMYMIYVCIIYICIRCSSTSSLIGLIANRGPTDETVTFFKTKLRATTEWRKIGSNLQRFVDMTRLVRFLSLVTLGRSILAPAKELQAVSWSQYQHMST